MTPRRALVLAFVANGLGGPSFVARLADRQRELDVSDAALGAALLGLAFGALLASPIVPRLIVRFGSRQVTAGAGIAIGATLWLAAVAPTAPAMFAGLAIVGAADAAMDIGMNANGAAYEAVGGRSVLHRLHAAWSFGALAGAGLATAAAAAGIGPAPQLVATGVVVAALSVIARPGLLAPDPPAVAVDDGAPLPRRWPAALVVLGVATVAAALLEGPPGDWSAVQLDRIGVDVGLAPLGTAAFMAGMFGGRLVGDRHTDRHGGAFVLRRGMALCAVGLVAGAAWGEPVPFLVGVALAGYGLSGYFPLAFSASARIPGVTGGAGTAVVSLGARAGFLLSPPLVGAIADATDLRVAFAATAAVAAAIAVAAPRIVSS